MSEHPYVLGTGDDELDRLGLQHRVWRDDAVAGFARAGFEPGQRLLDLGAGPGFVTFDLAALVGRSGKVIAVEISDRFVAHLRDGLARQGYRNVEVVQADAQEVSLEPASLDGAWARWVFTFLKEPRRAVAGVARALKPGASFLVHEYVAYASMHLGPRSAAFEKARDAVMASWRATGGEPDIALELPRCFAEHGLDVQSLRPLATVARPGELRWQWPETFFRNYIPVLCARGLLTPADEREFWRDWEAARDSRGGFFNGPQVLEIIARKRR